MPPQFPHPPKLSELLKVVNPLREVINDAHETIRSATDGIKTVASLLHVEEPPPSELLSSEPEVEAPVDIKEGTEAGTACITCSSEHFSESSGALEEAMRFARDKGIDHAEVLKRVRHSRDELNNLERFDLSPQQIARLPEIEKPIARWAVTKSRELRHSINGLSSIADLEEASAQAADIADEFEKKTMVLKQHYEREIHPEVADLRGWLEEREKGELKR